jgi:hypothetical protein
MMKRCGGALMGRKRAGRTKLNDTMGKASGKEEEEGSVIEVGS